MMRLPELPTTRACRRRRRRCSSLPLCELWLLLCVLPSLATSYDEVLHHREQDCVDCADQHVAPHNSTVQEPSSDQVFEDTAPSSFLFPAEALPSSSTIGRSTAELREFDSCNLYLAPSTLPKAGLGVFTTRPLVRGQRVTDMTDVVLPLSNGQALLPNYVWSPKLIDVLDESLSAFTPGLGALLNCHLGLVNAGQLRFDDSDELDIYDHAFEAKLGMEESPSTPFQDVITVALQDVPEYGELFGFYGDHWFKERPEHATTPTSDDYLAAEALVQGLTSLSVAPQITSDVMNLVQDIACWDDDKISKLGAALPATLDEAEQVAERGVRSLLQPLHVSSHENLVTQGRCLDHVRVGPSTILDAGQGLFANVAMSAGTIVTGSPLLHLPYGTGTAPPQLLHNYCFGASQSSLLLCPYASGVLHMNHNASRANVRIQWALPGQLHQDDRYLNATLTELQEQIEPVLAIDFVATRDIASGDELLLDYGVEWEAAWQQYQLERPEHNIKSADYLDGAAQWNAAAGRYSRVLRTQAEQAQRPYPANVELHCHADLMVPDPVLGVRSAWIDDNDANSKPCQVMSRRHDAHGQWVYNVSAYDNNVWHQRANVPRHLIRFADNLPVVFRQAMSLPEAMVPPQWRNDLPLSQDAAVSMHRR